MSERQFYRRHWRAELDIFASPISSHLSAAVKYLRMGKSRAWRACLVLISAISLSACGGGGGGGDAKATGETATPAPSVSFSASSGSVDTGQSVTLSWQSSNADQCVASGGWSGDKATAGNETVGPLQQSQNFVLSCSGAGGGALRELNVSVNSRGGVQVTLSSDSQYISVDGQTQLSWSATNADRCEASGGWQGDQALSGTYTTAPLSQDTSFKITCFAEGESAVALISVMVASSIVSWQPPTQNVDGTPLIDLAGFKVYYGDSSRNYAGVYAVNSSTQTEWDMAGLSSGTYFVAVTAIDADADESSYSNEVIKVVP